MRKALSYRLFGMGKMPPALTDAAASGDIILAAEGLPVHNRVTSLRIPGAKVGNGVRTAAGSVEVHYRIPLDAPVLARLPAAAGPVTLSHAAEALLSPWHGSYAGGGP